MFFFYSQLQPISHRGKPRPITIAMAAVVVAAVLNNLLWWGIGFAFHPVLTWLVARHFLSLQSLFVSLGGIISGHRLFFKMLQTETQPFPLLSLLLPLPLLLSLFLLYYHTF